MHSKREPTHRDVVGKRNSWVRGADAQRGIVEFELRVDLSMGRKIIEIP